MFNGPILKNEVALESIEMRNFQETLVTMIQLAS